MNQVINVTLKLELPECFDKDAAEIVKDHLMAQINQIVETYNVEQKSVEGKVSRICHINETWDAPSDKYNWR